MVDAVELVEVIIHEMKRAAAAKSAGQRKRQRLSAASNPLQLAPLGNSLVNPHALSTRLHGLGSLASLPDDVLLAHVASQLDTESLLQFGCCSKACLAFSRVEGLWKALFIQHTGGTLPLWAGSWRESYLALTRRGAVGPGPAQRVQLSAAPLSSDVLFQPILSASFDPNAIVETPSFRENIRRVEAAALHSGADLPDAPVILTGAMDDWPAMRDDDSARRWTLSNLAQRYPTALFRAEAVRTTFANYKAYHDACPLDESPLYVFAADFATSSAAEEPGIGGLGADYDVPQCFSEDLFRVLDEQRPDYRWLIVGPARSGSTWHQDPNGTSAWNAVTHGSKLWIAFPPQITPPGVHVSSDMSEVECPLSLAEWFISYWDQAIASYGHNADDTTTRDEMRIGICRQGEIFYVPSGWWHIVVNLEPSVAVTQNFVSSRELAHVLRFMRDRPDQVSGFKPPASAVAGADSSAADVFGDEHAECGVDSFNLFVKQLETREPKLLASAMRQLDELDDQRQAAARDRSAQVATSWTKLTGESSASTKASTFGFSFAIDSNESSDGDEP